MCMVRNLLMIKLETHACPEMTMVMQVSCHGKIGYSCLIKLVVINILFLNYEETCICETSNA